MALPLSVALSLPLSSCYRHFFYANLFSEPTVDRILHLLQWSTTRVVYCSMVPDTQKGFMLCFRLVRLAPRSLTTHGSYEKELLSPDSSSQPVSLVLGTFVECLIFVYDTTACSKFAQRFVIDIFAVTVTVTVTDTSRIVPLSVSSRGFCRRFWSRYLGSCAVLGGRRRRSRCKRWRIFPTSTT